MSKYRDVREAQRAMHDRREMRMTAARALGTHTRDEWHALRNSIGHCARCRWTPDDIRRLSPDHIVPVSLGGCDSIRNIQPLCHECNGSKGRDCTDFRSAVYSRPPCSDRCPCAAVRGAFL